ncbi:LSM domain protein [Theileria parva strain Muguga]|uniref:U6 snRNA-associated Sm-like protein LSm8 n=1 Tax=Theileria parva TaxID=5875 RepID=Q4MZU2_THEPA|nr:LSM domain protein [Theileria parva strain Muguga]EAN31155.1 LSM domain protein [Theileria parva strain Muguga]|eukprot:XP_763438.1 U6 snRNA-associated Sm-like protein LSm8 [Theileria parva strain Muguga]
MAPILEQFIECSVFVISVDGRVFVGVLKGFDQLTNLVLYNCLERVYHPDAPVEELELGIYLLRGDNIVLVGEVDVDVDRSMSGIEALPINPVIY